jgi:hypothetical protein
MYNNAHPPTVTKKKAKRGFPIRPEGGKKRQDSEQLTPQLQFQVTKS